MTGESSGRLRRMHHHQVAHVEPHAARLAGDARHEIRDLLLGGVESLLDEKPPIEDRPAQIGDARRLDPADRLAARRCR